MPNNALFAIPVAWLVAILPRAYALSVYTAHTKQKPDTLNPRSFSQQAANNKEVPQLIRDRVVRAESTVSNGLENIGLYAAAVVAGYSAGIEPQLLSKLAWTYVASRLVYTYVFIYNDKFNPFVRTGVFMSGMLINISLFVLAGLA